MPILTTKGGSRAVAATPGGSLLSPGGQWGSTGSVDSVAADLAPLPPDGSPLTLSMDGGPCRTLEPLAQRRPRAEQYARALGLYAQQLDPAWQLAGVTRRDLMERAEAMRRCGTAVVVSGSTGRIVRGHYCQTPQVCPICAHRARSRRVRDFVAPVLARVAEGYTPVHMVFTQRQLAGESLGDSIDRLRAGLRRFTRAGQRRKGGRSGGQWSRVAGAIVNLECKPNARGWHTHAHAIALLRPGESLDWETTHSETIAGVAVPMNPLRAEWLRATRGESYGIKVTQIPGDAVKGKLIGEVVKYAVYVGEVADGDTAAPARTIAETIAHTSGRRMISTYGILRNLHESSADEGAGDPGPYHSTIWNGQAYETITVSDTLPESQTAIQRAIARVIAVYRSGRRWAVQQGQAAADLDSLKDAMRFRVGSIVRHFAGARDDRRWDMSEVTRKYNDLLWARFCGHLPATG